MYNQSIGVKKIFILSIIFCLVVSGSSLLAKKATSSTDPEMRLKWYGQHEALKETSMFKNMGWQFLGPRIISGRMTDVAVVTPKGQHYTIYVAGASGGIWKSVNEGTTWEPIFEHAPSTAIGDIAITPSNPDIIWAGTGEANIFRSSQAGAGIFKSSDAGKTWKHMGLTDTNTIARIIVHPTNPDMVYVAASGHEWTDNTERGLYKTIDGGKTWKKILYINEKTALNDLIMDPSAPDTLYASTWQRIRHKWNDPRNEPGYKGSGIYKTTDGGKNWVPINNGLPEAQSRGRIGLDLCKTKPNVVYAFVDNYTVVGQWDEGTTDSYGRPKIGKIKGATVFRSDDSGQNWRQVSEDSPYMENLSSTYGWVFAQIRVDPNNENTIFVMGLGLNVSEDGGKTFRNMGQMHGDHHGLWIDPANSDYLINVNDGGLAISYDGGKEWRIMIDNLPLVQFFNIMYDMDEPFRVYGSVQDHGSYRGVVDLSKGRSNIPVQDWESAPGGEGSSHAIDPTDPNTVYSAGFYGNITRADMRTGKEKLIVPKAKKGEPPLRGQWLAPFIISPHNPRIIYHGMNFLSRSMNRGDSWERISPDLTYNDKNKIGDIQYQTIFAISESPLKFGLIYAGTDDGRLHVTQNSGKTWTEITRGLAYRKWVSRVVASAYNLGTVYVSQNGKRDDDFAAYLWKSTNFGKTWVDISANIPCGPINVVREDPENKNILYVGTDYGVYVTLDSGKSWQTLSGNFPTTYVHDLVVHPRDKILVAGTHGRGAWALDVSHIQQMDSKLLSKTAHLFAPQAARLPILSWRNYRETQNGVIYYYLKEAQDVKMTIKGMDGKSVKEIKTRGDAGLNVLVWDLMKKTDKKSRNWRRNAYVDAGRFKIEVTAGSDTLTGIIEVKK